MSNDPRLAALNDQESGRRQRTPGDFQRLADGSPYFWDGESFSKKDGSVRMTRAGRTSSAGSALKSSGGLALYTQTIDFHASISMIEEAHQQLGPYPELWNRDDKGQARTMRALLKTGQSRVGSWTKADRGTLIHSLLEACALAAMAGTTPDTDEMIAEFGPKAVELGMGVDVVAKAVTLFDEFFETTAEPVASELRCVNLRFNLAGTADLIMRLKRPLTFGEVTLPQGTLIGADLKTGKVGKLSYVGISAQLAGYFGEGSHQYLFDGDTDTVGWPEPHDPALNSEHAIVLHASVDEMLESGVLALDLVLFDLADGEAALELSETVNRFKLATPPEHLRNEQISVDVPADRRAVLSAEKLEAANAWLHGRITTISQLPVALGRLVEMWPDDVDQSAPRERKLTEEQVNPIARLLGYIEAEFHLPFPARDPRQDRSMR